MINVVFCINLKFNKTLVIGTIDGLIANQCREAMAKMLDERNI